jgi:hypothetical protein
MEEYMLRFTRLFWKNKDVLSDREREVWDRWLRGQKFSYVKNVPPLFDESQVPGSPARSPNRVNCRERDIDQRGVFGDGEGGGSGDEE